MALGDVQVHLVAVEVSVVWRSDRKIEAERGVRHDLNSVTHHRLLVQRWLSVEDDVITVNDVSLDDPAELQLDLASGLVVSQINARIVLANDEFGARMNVWSTLHQLGKLVDVVDCNTLWEGQDSGNLSWNTDLVQLKIWVTRDDSTC